MVRGGDISKKQIYRFYIGICVKWFDLELFMVNNVPIIQMASNVHFYNIFSVFRFVNLDKNFNPGSLQGVVISTPPSQEIVYNFKSTKPICLKF